MSPEHQCISPENHCLIFIRFSVILTATKKINLVPSIQNINSYKNFKMNIRTTIILCYLIFFLPVLVLGQPNSDTTSKAGLKREIKRSAPSEDAFMAVQKLAKPYLLEGDWYAAIAIFDEYKHLFPKMSHRFEKINNLLSMEDEGWIVEVMNDRVNSMQFNEFSPVPSFDGQFLYFASDRTQTGYGKEDVFVSQLINGSWAPAKNINGYINTASSEAPSSVSIDGTQLILFGNYEGSKGRGDLFISEFIDTTWTPVISFPTGVNTRYFEGDGFYSPDGKAFFFTSDRPEGVGKYHKRDEYFHGSYAGNLDIYVMVRTEFGTWSEPENLGFLVNTPFCDQDPYITPDGNTLYFSSEGHYGLGGLDIFKSQRISKDSWTRWSDPVNLGKDINTVWDDSGYKWDASGDSAFFTIAVNGKMNIYTIKDYSFLLPFIDPVQVYGMITGKDSSRVHAEINITYADSDSVISSTFTDSLFGVFHVHLDDNNTYRISAKKEGYSTVTKTLTLGDYGIGESTALDFSLTHIPVVIPKDTVLTIIEEEPAALDTAFIEVPVVIPEYEVPNILFEFRKQDIQPQQFFILNNLVEFMTNNPQINFEISGFTDDVGTDGINSKLSHDRVASVVGYIVNLGISEDRFITHYHGSQNPVQPNDSEEGRQQNRRVEIRQLKTH